GLEFPLDVQLLPNQRVLVAEHNGNRVTERDLKGKVVWQKQVESPLVAQRLPNGNTFIVNHNQMVEVNPDGKAVFHYVPPGGDQIMKAQKLRNGNTAFVLSGGAFVQIDGTGKEIRRFGVNVSTSGGRIDVLPNGHVLIPEHRHNRLVEYDTEG